MSVISSIRTLFNTPLPIDDSDQIKTLLDEALELKSKLPKIKALPSGHCSEKIASINQIRDDLKSWIFYADQVVRKNKHEDVRHAVWLQGQTGLLTFGATFIPAVGPFVAAAIFAGGTYISVQKAREIYLSDKKEAEGFAEELQEDIPNYLSRLKSVEDVLRDKSFKKELNKLKKQDPESWEKIDSLKSALLSGKE